MVILYNINININITINNRYYIELIYQKICKTQQH